MKKKHTKNINPTVSKISNSETILLSKYALCGRKNLDLSKNKKQADY